MIVTTKNILKYFLLGLVIILFSKIYIFDVITVSGDSMLYTLKSGEKLIMNKLFYNFRAPRKGEVIVFEYPLDKELQVIKRIIAVEGDTIEIINGRVKVNDKIIQERYISKDDNNNLNKKLVPEDTVFVLGDNRIISKDSRYKDIGFISMDNVKGLIIFVIWPLNSARKIF